MQQNFTMRAGFSLFETAIVLAIIGLIAGGVLVGQDMIKAAKLNGAITMVDRCKTAISTFKSKYEELPGDISNAHSIWDDGTNTVCGTAAQCNGDGDYNFDYVSATENEKLRAWQHLVLADLIPGNYTGFEAVAGDEVIGTNIPALEIEGAGLRFDTYSGVNVLQMGSSLGSGIAAGGALLPADAASIDAKIDDGVAYTGFVKSVDGTYHTCLVGGGATDDYNLDGTDRSCSMRFQFE